MKVLHAAETIKGGVATVLRTLVDAQIDIEGITNVYALVPNNQSNEMGKTPLQSILKFNRNGRNLRSFYEFTKDFMLTVWQHDPDIVHLHSSFAGFLGRISLCILKPWRRPFIVYCPHGWGFIIEGSRYKKFIYGIIEHTLSYVTDSIICVSYFEKEMAVKYKISKNKISVIYNGIEMPKEETIIQTKKTDPTLKLLFVGRLDYPKGFDYIIEIMKNLENKPFHLIVVGAPVNDESVPPNRKNITYTGWLKPHEVAKHYASADVLLMTSRWEAFGLVAIEAQSYGTPVIAHKLSSLSEIILNGKSGYLTEVGDVKGICKFLESTNRDSWLKMGKAGRSFVIDRFNKEKMIKKTYYLYSNLGIQK
jgi:glycosyltransferase involved in cell wall biosynthesis